MADSDSEDGSLPPNAQGDAVPANVHAAPQNQPVHPVWRASIPGGGGGGGSGSARKTGADPVTGKYAPISMLALEIRQRGELDGASSVGSDRGHGKRPVRSRPRARDYDDEDDDEDDGNDEDDDDEDDAGGLQAGAAFGGGSGGGGSGAGRKRPKTGCGHDAAVSDSEDGASVSSSVVRSAHKRMFPVPGINCVGCAIPAKVLAVDEFVSKNAEKMSESSLYKMAALVYKTKVADPAQDEGIQVPTWKWQEIRSHYQLHRIDARMQRFENIRTLSGIRKTLELSLLKENEEGELLLDKQNSEAIMKVIAMSSRELSLLNEMTSAASRPKK
mgnify:CR=1 FL=1